MRMMKRICCCLIATGLLMVSLGWLTDLMERKFSVFKFHNFFDKSKDFDVLFFGTSHVHNGILPMELWDDYGIASYNCGGNGNVIPTIYWTMKNTLDYAEPKLVVIDGYLLNLDIKTNRFSDVHGSMDAFPLNRTKLAAIWDLLHDEKMEEQIRQGTCADAAERKSLNLLWDFSVYHSRWSELEKNDFLTEYSKEAGAEAIYAVAVPDQVPEAAADVCLQGAQCWLRFLCRQLFPMNLVMNLVHLALGSRLMATGILI